MKPHYGNAVFLATIFRNEIFFCLIRHERLEANFSKSSDNRYNEKLMLNNRKTFEKLMTLLRNIYPDVPLPEGFEEFLWDRMKVEPFYRENKILEFQGEKPKNAYYVASGLVTVHGYLDGVPFTESIYRENTIVALNAFMKQKDADHTITATKGTLVWSISHTTMKEIYRKWPPLKAFALQTALNYLEMKKERRNSFLVMPDEERVLEFYIAFKGLLPPRNSPMEDKEIASYLLLSIDVLRRVRRKLKKAGLFKKDGLSVHAAQ